MPVAVALAVACRQDVTVVDTLPAPPDTTGNGSGGGGGSLQRARLALTVLVAYQDDAVGAALGWPGGAVPAATVTVERTRAPVERRTGVTDDSGRLAFDSLLTGDYAVSALRLLDAGERARLPVGANDVGGLAGAAGVAVAAGGSAFTIGAVAGRRGSLIISEYWFPASLLGIQSFYPWGGYLELYNNSDTTIYLDGKLVGEAGTKLYDVASRPCSNYEPWADDPNGLWTRSVYQFPGSGRDYPLPPGRAAVLATDAIDHRVVLAEAEDLSHADFEFFGGPDNPNAPNLVNVGTSEHWAGNGVLFRFSGDVAFVADAVDVASLPRALIADYPIMSLRIPAAAVLDVYIWTWEGSTLPVCPHPVNERFGRLPPAIQPGGDFLPASMQRRVFRQEGDRKILQRTLSSGRDFVVAYPRTPGRP